jgi:hypothetical protein
VVQNHVLPLPHHSFGRRRQVNDFIIRRHRCGGCKSGFFQSAPLGDSFLRRHGAGVMDGLIKRHWVVESNSSSQWMPNREESGYWQRTDGCGSVLYEGLVWVGQGCNSAFWAGKVRSRKAHESTGKIVHRQMSAYEWFPRAYNQGESRGQKNGGSSKKFVYSFMSYLYEL